MQFEAASQEEMVKTAEELAPCKCEFKAFELTEYEEDLPVSEFVSIEKAKELGY